MCCGAPPIWQGRTPAMTMVCECRPRKTCQRSLILQRLQLAEQVAHVQNTCPHVTAVHSLPGVICPSVRTPHCHCNPDFIQTDVLLLQPNVASGSSGHITAAYSSATVFNPQGCTHLSAVSPTSFSFGVNICRFCCCNLHNQWALDTASRGHCLAGCGSDSNFPQAWPTGQRWPMCALMRR